MSLFSYNQVVENKMVYIPRNFRAFFGWHDHLGMYLSSLQHPVLKENLANELILSTVPLTDRLDLWKFTASFRDRKGIVKELSNIFKLLNINILSAKVSTVDQNRYLNVEFDMDCQLYKGYFDKETSARKKNKHLYLDELKNLIIAEFIEDVLFVNSEKKARPLVKIKRNLPLFRSCVEFKSFDKVNLLDGRITIPSEMLNDITEKFKNQYPLVSNLKGRRGLPIASVAADFESYLIRIFLFFLDTGHLHFRIKAKNKVGAIATMSELLYDAKININQMFSRPVTDGNYALTDFLIHHVDPSEVLDDNQLRKKLKDCFNKSRYKDYYEFEVIFPEMKKYNGHD